MSLYLIQFDGETYPVEDVSMQRAIATWKEWGRENWAGEWDDTEEPESCFLVCDKEVLRPAPSEPACESCGKPADGYTTDDVPRCGDCGKELNRETQQKNRERACPSS
jgi:hypothetical protein